MELCEVEVISVTPAWHVNGERMVKVEFGGEEIGDVVSIKEGEKIAARINFDTRGIVAPKNPIYTILTLFVPYPQWGRMKKKYTVGDKYKLNIDDSGAISLKKAND